MTGLSRDALASLALAGVGLEVREGTLLFTAPEDAPDALTDAVRCRRDEFSHLCDDRRVRATWRIPPDVRLCPQLRMVLVWLEAERCSFDREAWRCWLERKTRLLDDCVPRYIADILAVDAVVHGAPKVSTKRSGAYDRAA